MRGAQTYIALAGAAALAITLSACEKYEGHRGGAAAADVAAAKDAIKADEKAWNEQFKARNTEALVGHYANDAFFVVPGAKPAEGSTAIRQTYAQAGADKNFAIQFASDKIEVSGDLAYGRGHFTEKYTDPKTGKVMTDNGSYITVYKRQDDGGWKAVEDFAVADPDSAKEVPPEKPATRAKMVSF
ncbi:MAG: DUF4440 domain-containing protein [Pseudomonadota bacterium]